MLPTDISQMSARQQEEEVKAHLFIFTESEKNKNHMPQSKTDQRNKDNLDYQMPPDSTGQHNMIYESQLLPFVT